MNAAPLESLPRGTLLNGGRYVLDRELNREAADVNGACS
jgi:hypothetical protein